jgi:hypothetical protein
MDNEHPDSLRRLDRREVLRWIGGAAAAAAAASRLPIGEAQTTARIGRDTAPFKSGGPRIGWDPVLNKNYSPGDLWPLTLDAPRRRAAAALCDLILPPEPGDKKPSELGVPDFIDEWISSPYDETNKDRPVILEGLAWIDAESGRRFGGKVFADLTEQQQCAIADDICGKTPVRSEFKQAQRFFDRFRYLAASGYYTTPQGWKDIGYVGNVPMVEFPGPTPEALKHLGLE